jgi:hypothetical protein
VTPCSKGSLPVAQLAHSAGVETGPKAPSRAAAPLSNSAAKVGSFPCSESGSRESSVAADRAMTTTWGAASGSIATSRGGRGSGGRKLVRRSNIAYTVPRATSTTRTRLRVP